MLMSVLRALAVADIGHHGGDLEAALLVVGDDLDQPAAIATGRPAIEVAATIDHLRVVRLGASVIGSVLLGLGQRLEGIPHLARRDLGLSGKLMEVAAGPVDATRPVV